MSATIYVLIPCGCFLSGSAAFCCLEIFSSRGVCFARTNTLLVQRVLKACNLDRLLKACCKERSLVHAELRTLTFTSEPFIPQQNPLHLLGCGLQRASQLGACRILRAMNALSERIKNTCS